RTAWNSCTANAGNTGGALNKWVADADGAGLASRAADVITDIDIVVACGEVDAGVFAQRDVEAAGGVALERLNTDGGVVAAGGVGKEGRFSGGSIVLASGVAQKRACAGGRVLVADMGKKCSSAESRVEATASYVPQRKQTNCGIVHAAGKTKKGGLPFCRIAAG